MVTSRIIDTQALRAVVADVGLDRLIDEAIAGLGRAFRELDESNTKTIDRTGFTYTKPDVGAIEWAPALAVGDRVVVTTTARHPSNPMQRGQPTVLGTSATYDTTSGRLISLTDATLLNVLATSAAAALATAEMAALDAETVGVIGAGAQAVAAVHALSRIRPVAKVLVFDADPQIAASFERRLPIECEVVVIEAKKLNEKLLGVVDILCTCTSVAAEVNSVFGDGKHQPFLHINALGGDGAGQTEVPASLLQRAVVIADNTKQSLERGEGQALDADDLGPNLAHLIAAGGTQHRDRLTVFDATGEALQGLVISELLLAHAERIDVGYELEIQPAPRDPFDPYEQFR